MDKNRLVLTLMLNEGILVNSRNFETNNICEIETVLTYLNFNIIDELILLDISREDKSIDKFRTQVEKITKKCFIPVSAGGGVKTIEDCKKLLLSGVDKVIINSEAIDNIGFIRAVSNAFGKQFVVVSIDVKKENNRFVVYKNNATKKTSLDLKQYLDDLENAGAGEIYLRSIDNDGSQMGYDLPLLEFVRENSSLPIIIAGGLGKFEHLKEGIDKGANAVSVGNLFHYVGEGLYKAKDYMKQKGLNVSTSQWNFSVKSEIDYEVYSVV